MGWNSFVKPGHRVGVTLPGGGRGATALPMLCFCMAVASVFADGVTRSVEPVPGGCKVTLAWEFSGKIESDLIIEERFAQGWSVDDSTVPFGSLDASWFSGRVARFAVKPVLLSEAGSISFTVMSGEGGTSGAVSGDWKMYLGGGLRKGRIAGKDGLVGLWGAGATGAAAGTGGTGEVAGKAVTITSFNIAGGAIELSYSGVGEAGTLVVEGGKGLGDKSWVEVKRLPVAAGDGKVDVGLGEACGCCFFRIKFLAEEK